MKMVFQIQGFRQKFLVWVMTLLLQVKFTQNFAVKQVISWTKNRLFHPKLFLVIRHFQEPVADITGDKVCRFCSYIEFEEEPHESCRKLLKIIGSSDDELYDLYLQKKVLYQDIENAVYDDSEVHFLLNEIDRRPDLKNKIGSLR